MTNDNLTQSYTQELVGDPLVLKGNRESKAEHTIQ